MWAKYKPYLIGALVLVVVFGAGFVLGRSGDNNNDDGRSAAISGQLREAVANNQRLAAKNAELERINNELGEKIAAIESESAELRVELEASQRDAAATAENNRRIEVGLQEARDLTESDLGRIRAIRERAPAAAK